MSRKRITFDNLPAKLPVLATIVYLLALDRINAPGWAYGIFFTLAAIVWIRAIVGLFDKHVDIFDDTNSGGPRP